MPSSLSPARPEADDPASECINSYGRTSPDNPVHELRARLEAEARELRRRLLALELEVRVAVHRAVNGRPKRQSSPCQGRSRAVRSAPGRTAGSRRSRASASRGDPDPADPPSPGLFDGGRR